ncbi:heptaprenyl diphosphate synthase [Lentibacillus halodurans]|uniref:Heptaprenyl diphosphate synthase n=1 Tax=Lentibacillus halodurans TaxID=237679 RepID=A0A1I0VBK5_9BACI|nr:heptaprenyl diphosphate synthase [Lentibacillus halodurans]
MQTSSMEISHLKALINQKMYYAYIEQYVQTPQLDDDKLYILTSILNNTALPESKKEHYIVTAMLVQMALDTHDLVPNSNDFVHTDHDEKSKQLSVLAGDYYSGLYYLILSEIEEVKMTQVLATAITDINEYKMQLYYKDFDSFDTFIQVFKKLESLLITRIAAFVGEKTISGITPEWLMTRRLEAAKNRITQSGFDKVFGSWSEQIPVSDHHDALYAMNTFIRKETLLIEKRLPHFPAHLSAIKSYIKGTIETAPSNKSSLAEEG